MLDMSDIGYYLYMDSEERNQILQRVADRAIAYVDSKGEIAQYIILSLAEDEGLDRNHIAQQDFQTILRLMAKKNLYF